MSKVLLWTIGIIFACACFLAGRQTALPKEEVARLNINGHVIQYEPGVGVEVESRTRSISDAGQSYRERAVDATSGALETNDADATFNQSAPTDGDGGSAGGILSQVTAQADGMSLIMMGVIIMLGGILLVFKPFPGMAMLVGGGPGLGLTVIGLGAVLVLIGWFKDEYAWAIWLLLPCAVIAMILLLRSTGVLKKTQVELDKKEIALTKVAVGVQSLDDETRKKVTDNIKIAAGTMNDLVKHEVKSVLHGV